jgi:hypothetical protein
MNDGESIEDWLERMIAGTVSHNDRGKGYLNSVLSRLPSVKLEEMIQGAERHDFLNFKPEFLSACIRVLVGDEIIRRFSGMRDGTISPMDAMTPPLEDPSDQWDEDTPTL